MTAARRVRLVGLAALFFAAASSWYAGWGHPAWWAFPALTLAVLIGESAVVHLAFGRQRWTFSCTEGVIAAAFVTALGAWSIVAIAVGVFGAQLLRRQPRMKLEFNVVQIATSAAVGAAVAHYAHGGISGAVAGMGAFWFVNHVLIAIAVSLTSRQALRVTLFESAPLSAAHSAGNSSVGLLATWLVFHGPVGLLGLVVPMGLLWTSYDQQTRRAAEAKLFAELARGQEEASGRSLDVSAQAVVTATARLFGGADVELVVLAADGPVLYVGDEYGVPERRRVEPSYLDEDWVIRALGAPAVTTGKDEGRPYCSAVLGDPAEPLAVFIARRPEGTGGFGRRETMLATVLAGQAETWLSVAELTRSRDEAMTHAEAMNDAARALGDVGADTAPALAVLRESAARLARLADALGGRDRVGEIVEELYTVERAVASLLGAIALAAHPELTDVGRDVSGPDVITLPRQRDAEWTTTGVLDRNGSP